MKIFALSIMLFVWRPAMANGDLVGKPLYITWAHFECQETEKVIFGQVFKMLNVRVVDVVSAKYDPVIGLGVESVGGLLLGMDCESLRASIKDAYESFFDAEVVSVTTKKTDGEVVRSVEMSFPAVPDLVLKGDRILQDD